MKVSEKGFSTIIAVGIITLVFLLILSGFVMIGLASKLIARQLLYQGQALNAAQAGLVESLNYFRREGKVVTKFDPKSDLDALPVPIDDSDEPKVGIVRDYLVSDLGNLCARYEVRRQDLDDDGVVDPDEEGRGVQDVTVNRGKLGAPAGNMWMLESHGFIYIDPSRKCDLNDDGDDDPNNDPAPAPNYFYKDLIYSLDKPKVLVRRTLRTQIQRIDINLPAKAAVYNEKGTDIDIGNSGDKVRLLGGLGGYGVYYSGGSGPASIDPDCDVQGGTADEGEGPPYFDEILQVFGVTRAELESSADGVFDNATGGGTTPPESWSLKLYIVRNGNWDAGKPLIGSGVLVVLGDCNVPASSSFNGFIYATGKYTQEGPSIVSGAVMARKGVKIFGAGDLAEVDYDDNMMTQVKNDMIQYRFGRNPYMYTTN